MKPAPARVAVAASGGRDSTALLHCTLRAAAPLGVEVVALHVHHGLMADADGWLAQVQQQSRRWGAAFMATRLQNKPAAGESVEAWARRERYKALASMARAAGCSVVLLGHHRRDQAETFLLQALRGAGAAGLAAMPVAATRQGVTWARPWLDHPREAVEAYVARHRLRFVDDTSNADARFARNRLRLQVWPALAQAFPDAESCLAQAACQSAQAAALAAEAAALDLPPLLDDRALCLAPWLALPPARRRNALQAWLHGALAAPLPGSLLQRLCDELPGCRSGRWPAPRAELRLYRGRLTCHLEAPASVSAFTVASASASASASAPASSRAPALGEPMPAAGLDLSRPGLVSLPGFAGHFEVTVASEGGAAATLLQRVQARPRQGGERFHLTPRGTARSLKKQYQAAAVPAWARSGPLLWLPDGELLFAPGLGIDASLRAEAGAPQLALRWCPGPPGSRQTPG